MRLFPLANVWDINPQNRGEVDLVLLLLHEDLPHLLEATKEGADLGVG